MTDQPKTEALDIIVPVYNERLEVVQSTVRALKAAFADRENVNVIVVDDGSDPSCGLARLPDEPGVTVLRHEVNRGYGTALKTGIRHGVAPWIAIADADGTYPLEELPAMVKKMAASDMIVGARVGDMAEIPWLRRFPKAMLNRFASYMAGTPILDLNSGMRVFTRDLCQSLWGLLPSGFSFTSTLTMGALLFGYRMDDHVINYYRRIGQSTIRPLRDTVRFFFIVLRLGALFFPMKVFGPIAALLFGAGAGKGFLRDFPLQGYIGNLSVTLMLAAVQVFMMGLLGEMIVHNRNVSPAADARRMG